MWVHFLCKCKRVRFSIWGRGYSVLFGDRYLALLLWYGLKFITETISSEWYSMNSETFTFNLFMVNTISVNIRKIYIVLKKIWNLYNIINMDSMHGQYAFIMTQEDRYWPQIHEVYRPRASALGRYTTCIFGQYLSSWVIINAYWPTLSPYLYNNYFLTISDNYESLIQCLYCLKGDCADVLYSNS